MTEEEILERRDQIEAYLRAAHRALEAASSNLEQGFYDYEVTLEADRSLAEKSLDAAQRFVDRISAYLFATGGIQT